MCPLGLLPQTLQAALTASLTARCTTDSYKHSLARPPGPRRAVVSSAPGDPREKRRNLVRSQFARMALPVIDNEAPNPRHIGLLRPETVVSETDRGSSLIQQLGRGRWWRRRDLIAVHAGLQKLEPYHREF